MVFSWSNSASPYWRYAVATGLMISSMAHFFLRRNEYILWTYYPWIFKYKLLTYFYRIVMPFGLPFPRNSHITINYLKPRVIIVGDVHGCLDELQLLLKKSSYNFEDSTLIFAGDLVNKGPKSAEVVKFVRSLNAFSVRGNHDDNVLSYLLKIRVPKDSSYDFIKRLSRYTRSI